MHRARQFIETRGLFELFEEIGSGGMATVRLARWIGHNGFSRVVAVKQLYPQFARDSDFVAMFLDEARLSARVRHPNVVPILDIVSSDGDLFLVMEYVHGESVSRLHKLARLRKETIPPGIACTILAAVMHGLHAAHEARTEHDEPLKIIHRDVTPQNVLVGVDGCPRILDFGVAQAAGRLQTTRDGQLKGKLCYMAPEQLLGGVLDRRVDIYSASAMLWEMLAGRKLFTGTNEGEVVKMVLDKPVPPPSLFNPQVPPALDDIVLQGLQREPQHRFSTAREVALAIERQVEMVAASEVGGWVERVWGESLKVRTRHLVQLESSEKSTPGPEISGGDLPTVESGADGENDHAAGAGRSFSPDRSMISTRRIIGVGSLLSAAAAPDVVATMPPREPRVRRVRGAGIWALATVAVATLAILLVARSTVRRSKDSNPGLASGAGMQSTPNQPSPPAVRPRAQGSESQASEPQRAPSPAVATAAPLSPGDSDDATIATSVTPVVKSRMLPESRKDRGEIASRGKNRTRRRIATVRMAQDTGSQTKDQREIVPPAEKESPARAECDPPFIIDASHIKRMKVSCL